MQTLLLVIIAVLSMWIIGEKSLRRHRERELASMKHPFQRGDGETQQASGIGVVIPLLVGGVLFFSFWLIISAS